MLSLRTTLTLTTLLVLISIGLAQAAEIPNFSRQTEPASSPVELTTEPNLLIDDYLIAHSTHLKRTTHHPTRAFDHPVIGHEAGTTQPYVTVLRDADTGKFRMWYNRGGAIAYAESDDGVHWHTPNLGILGDDNRLLQISSDSQHGYGVSVVDEGPDTADPDRRYKMAWWGQIKPWPDGDPGMRVAFSGDGIHWKRFEGNPVLPDFGEAQFLDDPRRASGAGDIIDVFWDPYRKHYSAFFKSPAISSDGLETGPKASVYIRRLVSASTSDNFTDWEQPWRVIVPEDRDEGLLEFYGVGGTISRGGLLIGFVRMLRDDLPATEGGPAEGIGYTTLVTSRDGKHWERHSDVFFDRHPDPDAWDHAMTWIGSLVNVDDETYIYYGGYKQGHKIEPATERQIGLARMPRDRFVSRDSGEGQMATLKTVPLIPPGETECELVLNADCDQGSMRVRVLNADTGEALPEFDWSDPIRGDGPALKVKWRGHSRLPSQTFQLEFELTDAQLFAFQFTN